MKSKSDSGRRPQEPALRPKIGRLASGRMQPSSFQAPATSQSKPPSHIPIADVISRAYPRGWNHRSIDRERQRGRETSGNEADCDADCEMAFQAFIVCLKYGTRSLCKFIIDE